MLSNLVLTVTRKQHVTCTVSEILELFLFSKSSCWMSGCRVPGLDSVTVSARSLAVWSAFPSDSCRFQRRWLMCDSRWEARKSVMAGNDTSWTVSFNCLFEVFCWEFLCRVSWQMERHSKTHWVLWQLLQTAGYSSSQSCLLSVALIKWIIFSPMKWELYYSSLIFTTC